MCVLVFPPPLSFYLPYLSLASLYVSVCVLIFLHSLCICTCVLFPFSLTACVHVCVRVNMYDACMSACRCVLLSLYVCALFPLSVYIICVRVRECSSNSLVFSQSLSLSISLSLSLSVCYNCTTQTRSCVYDEPVPDGDSDSLGNPDLDQFVQCRPDSDSELDPRHFM